MSRFRPRAPIIAVTRNGQTARQAHLYRGIFPVLCKEPTHDAWAEDVDLRVNLGMNVGESCGFTFTVLGLPRLEGEILSNILLFEAGHTACDKRQDFLQKG